MSPWQGVHGHVHGPCWELGIISQKRRLCTPAGQSRVPGCAQRGGAVGWLTLRVVSSDARTPSAGQQGGKRAPPKPGPVVHAFPGAFSHAPAHPSYSHVTCDD